MKTVLETQTVTKTYRVDEATFYAVDHVSIHVDAGEFIAVVGPSGSGKTTMLAMFAALLHPSAGTITINGVNIHALSEKSAPAFAVRRLGSLFNPTIWFHT